MAADSELYKKGEAVRRRLMGETAISSAGRPSIHSDPVMTKFIDVVTETVFGSLWTRPGLDIKTRTLIYVVFARTPRPAAIPSSTSICALPSRKAGPRPSSPRCCSTSPATWACPIIREAMLTAAKVFKDVKAEGTGR